MLFFLGCLSETSVKISQHNNQPLCNLSPITECLQNILGIKKVIGAKDS
jgi:hypothetical protein